ncbi:fibroblast growth factor-binding protein 1 [Hypomesus transpacificus]|uniref:fibroblast growth factor-binding protein 1 n=1 Tax=Hypomesus transpacificus TaxID=137520 RepID=UPI001F08415C|nr:fibroblast growth factor-binding protein 1 [Hypomesus transpacificus]
MTFLTNLALLLFLACMSQQFIAANCQRGQARKGKTDGKEKERVGLQKEGELNTPVPSPDKKDSSRKSPNRSVLKGKFSTKNHTHCTWAATGDEAFTLGISCKKDGKSFDCEYSAKPSLCPQYESNAKMYWKQIARALRKQRKLCVHTTSLVRAGMCRKAPSDAHFKLNSVGMPTPPSALPQPSGLRACPDMVDKRKLAEDYCDQSWSSFCTFFFSMVQDDDC